MTPSSAQEDTEYLPERASRVDWMKLAAEVYKAMIGLDTAVQKGFQTTLPNMVEIRASR